MSEQLVLVPDMGVDGPVEVIEINIAVGDEVNVDDIIAVMESDKATLEVPSSHSGKIESLTIKLGDKVSQGDVLLSLVEGSGQSDIDTSEITGSVEEPAADIALTVDASHLQDKSADKPSQSSLTITIEVPDIGAESAEVIELVAEGQKLNKEDMVVVLESDKASMEVPALQAGIIQKLWVKVGDRLKQGDKLADMRVAAQAKTNSEKGNRKEDTSPAPIIRPEIPNKTANHSSLNEDVDTVHAGPAVRRMAREFGIPLSKINGSGPKERILKEDLMAYTSQKLAQVSTENSGGVSLEPLPEIDFNRFGETQTIPRSRIQKISAKNLLRSWNIIPQVTQFDEADITDLEGFRQAQKESAKSEGYKLTLLAFLVKASVGVLKKYPDFNSSLDNSGENLIRKHFFNIGVAVETPNGLVVPVVKDADKKGVKEIAIEIISLAEKARNKKLKPLEMQGATFTISSLGGLGGTKFTPIVNWPEVAILGVSRSELRPTYINNELKPRRWLPLSLSYDHRVIDGAEGARFTRTLSEMLADIRNLLL